MNESKKLNIIVVVIATVVILASAITTVIVSGKFGAGADKKAYQNVTFTDAVLTCDERLKRTYTDAVHTVYLDNHSSRYDNASLHFKLFYNLHLKAGSKTSKNYVNCFVRAATGSIVEFEVFEQMNGIKSNRPTRTTNAFGMPLKNK